MTCNQLITLLNIYRGTEDLEHKVGMYETDILILKSKDLIYDTDFGHNTTLTGTKLVKKILEQK